MTRRVLGFALGMAVFAAAVPAVAQDTKPLGLSVRLGGFFPSDEGARNNSRTWLAGGLEYKILSFATGSKMPGSLSLSADHYGNNDFSAFPVMLNYVGSRDEWSYSVGVGPSYTRRFIDFEGPNEHRSTGTKLGYQVGLAYNFKSGRTPIFIEAKYFGVAGATELNGFGVYLGIRL